MKEGMHKMVMFDFDGVIVDTYDLAYGISVRHNPGLTEERYKSFFSGDFYDSNLKDHREEDGRKIHFFDDYGAGIHSIQVREAVRDEVQKLSGKYRLVIVSSTTSSVIRDYLTNQGLIEHFSDILGSDVHRSKTEKIKMAMDKYRLEPEDCVFITDTSGDVKEAKRCGVKSICVTWGYHPREELEAIKPEAIVSDPKELSLAADTILGE